MGRGLRIYFHRSQPYLCCGQIWKRQVSCGKSWTWSKIVKLCEWSNFWGLPRGRRDEWGGSWEYIFIDLNLAYVVAIFELARCLVEKVEQGCETVWMVKFFRATLGQEGRMGRGLRIYFHRSQTYLCCGQIWTRQVSGEKSWTGSKIVKLCGTSNFWGLPRGRKDEWGEGWEFIFIDLNLTYVVAKFENARCLVEKVGHGQRLWNCVNGQIFEGYPGAGGTNGEGVENIFS